MTQSTSSEVRSPALQGLASLAWLLERIERDARPDPAQYQTLVSRVREQLQQQPMCPQLAALLDRFPATADIYENLRYEHAGLCRAPLERSVGTERQAHAILARVARGLPRD